MEIKQNERIDNSRLYKLLHAGLGILLMFYFTSAMGQVSSEPIFTKALSENQDFIVTDDAPIGEYVGSIKAFPEFEMTGETPFFESTSDASDIFSVDSSGLIKVINNSLFNYAVKSVYTLNVLVSKPDYKTTEIVVTINLLKASDCLFFDFSKSVNGSGTRANPYNSIKAINQDNSIYLFKRGTTAGLTGTIQSNGFNNILCASYGSGNMPILTHTTGGVVFTIAHGTNGFTIRDIEITTLSPSADGSNWGGSVYGSAYNGAWKNIKVLHNYFHHCSGVALISNTPEPYAETATVEWNYIHDIPSDGVFIKNTTGITNINNNHIERINLNWNFVGHTEAEANGDGIQTYDVFETIVKHNYIDRTFTGNKFCIILDSRNNIEPVTVSDNYLIPTTSGDMKTWGVYVFFMNGKISRNYFKGGEYGIYNGRSDSDIIIDYNIFDQCDVGIQDSKSKNYNNVFYGNNSCLSYGGNEFKNNIVYFTSASQKVYDYWFTVNSDNNLYNEEHANMFGSGKNTISTQKPSRENTSIISAPLFADISKRNFHISPESLAKGKGISFGLSTDYEGSSIGITSNIGVFERTSDGEIIITPNNPPSVNLRYDDLMHAGFVYDLDASNSFDADDQSLTFTWQIPESISTSDNKGPIISILASESEALTPYNIKLKVSDGIDSVEKSYSISFSPYKPEIKELKVTSIEASNFQDPNYPENMVDNNNDTKWAVEGIGEWAILKLDGKATIDHIDIVYQNRESNNAYFDTYTSNDKENWAPVLTNLQSCGFSNNKQSYAIPATKTDVGFNYVKIVVNGNSENDWNSIAEIKVYGAQSAQDKIASKIQVTNSDIVEVYPTSASDNLNIILESKSTVQIFSLSGREMYTNLLEKGVNNISFSFNPGIYVVRVTDDKNFVYNQKIIVK